MRAAVCTRNGPPEVLRVEDLATPVPRKNEVRIRILATAVTSAGLRAPRAVEAKVMRIGSWLAPVVGLGAEERPFDASGGPRSRAG